MKLLEKEGEIQMFNDLLTWRKYEIQFNLCLCTWRTQNSNLRLLIDLKKVEIQNFSCTSDENDSGYDFFHYTYIRRRKLVEYWVTIGLRWQLLPIHQA